MSRGRGRGGAGNALIQQIYGKPAASPEAMASILSGFKEKIGGDVAAGWIQVCLLGEDGRDTELGFIPLTAADPMVEIRRQWGPVYGTGPYIVRPTTADRRPIPDLFHVINLPQDFPTQQEDYTMVAFNQPVSPELQEIENDVKKVEAEKKLIKAKRERDKVEAGVDEAPAAAPPWRGRGAAPAAPPGYPGYPGGYPAFPGYPFHPGFRPQATDDGDEKVAEELNKTRRDVQMLEDTIKALGAKLDKKEEDTKRENESRELREHIRALEAKMTARPNDELMTLVRSLEQRINNPPKQEGDALSAVIIKSLLDGKQSDKFTELAMNTSAKEAERREADHRERLANQTEMHKLMLEVSNKRGPEFEAISGFMGMANSMMTQSLEGQLAFMSAAKKLGDPENAGRPWTEIIAGAFKDFTGQRESTERVKLQLIAKAIEKGRPAEEIRAILGETAAPATPPAPQQQVIENKPASKQLPSNGTAAPPQTPEAPLMLVTAVRKYRDIIQVILPIVAEAIREGEDPSEALDFALGVIHESTGGQQGSKISLGLSLLSRTPYKVVLPLVVEFCDDEDRETLRSPQAVEWWRALREHIKNEMSGEAKPEEPTSPGTVVLDHGPVEPTPITADAQAAQAPEPGTTVIDAVPVSSAKVDALGTKG